MEYGVQQIDADVIVWVKDNCLAAPYLLSYVLGEMATIAYRFVSDGYFIRGEVAYGAGWNLYRDSGGACLYGPVIALAYDRLNKGMYALEVRVSERVMVELQSNPLVSRSEGGQNPYFTKYPHNDAYYLNIESRCRRCHHLKFKDGTLRDDSGDVWKRWDESRRMLTDFNEKVVCACNAGEFLTNRDMLSKAVALYDFVNHSKSFLSGGVI